MEEKCKTGMLNQVLQISTSNGVISQENLQKRALMKLSVPKQMI
jgi:hypothetical protein